MCLLGSSLGSFDLESADWWILLLVTFLACSGARLFCRPLLLYLFCLGCLGYLGYLARLGAMLAFMLFCWMMPTSCSSGFLFVFFFFLGSCLGSLALPWPFFS